MFDEKEALKCLEEDRRKYLNDTIEFTKAYLDRHLDELAASTIMAAAENLRCLDGSMQYVKELCQFKENGYPRFGRILE